MKTYFRFLILTAICTLSSFGGSNGSIYSRYGIGELNYFPSSRTIASGGTGVALLTDGYINRLNPAALARIQQVRFEADFQYRGYAMDDGTASSFLSTGNFQGAFLALPIYTKSGIVFGFGISPLSSVSYTVIGKESINSRDVTRTSEGRGGFSKALFSLSYNPMTDVYCGFTTNYLFGAIHREQSLSFPTTGLQGSKNTQFLSAEGFGYTVGFLFTGVDKALNLSEEKNLLVGVTLFSGASLNAREEQRDNYATVTDTLTASENGTLKIPFGISLGTSYLLRDRTILSTDFNFQQWGNFSILGKHPSELRNAFRIGTGIEFLPSHSLSETYWDQISYRLGAFINVSQLRINNEPINEYFLTGGCSLPISSAGGDAKFNFGIEYGIRGSTAAGLQKESILRMTFSLSAVELFWFVPPAIE
jgi:hypothetical protein